jgi:hypothetical protein
LGAKYDEYDFNKDGIISSDDALQYQRYLDSLVSTEEGGETVLRKAERLLLLAVGRL